jgi:hypothetical protein
MICGRPVLPADVQDYHPNAAIGDVLDPWDGNIDTYTLQDILRLVIFYNDDLGIDSGDTAQVRRDKLVAWLCGQD